MHILHKILIVIISLAVLQFFLEIMHLIIVKKGKRKTGDESSFWILGIFYFNPNDPRIFVPTKLTFFGWAFNLGQPVTSVMIIVLFLIIILLAVFGK